MSRRQRRQLARSISDAEPARRGEILCALVRRGFRAWEGLPFSGASLEETGLFGADLEGATLPATAQVASARRLGSRAPDPAPWWRRLFGGDE